MKNWLNNLTGRLGRRIDKSGQKLLKEYDAEASKNMGMGRVSKKAKGLKRDLERLEKLKNKADKNRKVSAGVILGTTGVGGGTFAYHKSKDKAKTQKLKSSLANKAQDIYIKGQTDYETRMLQDPNFPLPVKLKLLENRGVIKQASFKKILSLDNIREAKKTTEGLKLKVNELTLSNAPKAKQAEEALDLAKRKLRNERLKSYGTYAGGVGLAGTGAYAYMSKKASKYSLPLIGAGSGAVAGPLIAAAHPEIENTKGNLLEAAALGGMFGGIAGGAAKYIQVKDAKRVKQMTPQLPNNTQPMEDIPVT